MALLLLLGYKFSPLLLPPSDVFVQPDAACDLQREACTVQLPDGGKLTLSLLPRPVPLMKPFQVEVKLSDTSAQSVEVDFAGADMNMGYNRFALRDQGQGVYRAEASIPVCVTGLMAWQVSLLIDTGRQRMTLPFRFTSGAHD